MRIFQRIACLTLALLLAAGTALAAPMRDRRDMCLTEGELMELSSLLDIYMQSALFQNADTLERGQAPGAAYVEDVLLRVLSMGLFALDGVSETEGVVTASGAALDTLYGQLFASGRFALPETPGSQLVHRAGDGLSFDLGADGEQYIGVYPYEAVPEDTGVRVRADVYLAGAGFLGELAEAHEDEITWLAGYEIHLATNNASPYGYTLAGYTCLGQFRDVRYYEYVDEEAGFSITLPDLFAREAMQPTDAGVRCQAKDGAVLEIGMRPNPHALSVDAYMQEWLSEHPGAQVALSGEFSYFTGSFTTGEVQVMTMAYVAGERVYMFELQFPAAYAAEYTLYAEFLRNSFVVSDLSVG